MDNHSYEIEFLKSGLSVNTHLGCYLGCKYCVLGSSLESFHNYPRKVSDAEMIMNYLLSDEAYYLDGNTPLFVNNRTDPFLPEVLDSTYKLLAKFAENNITSPVLVISKLAPDERFTEFCKKLNLIYLYTFANLPGIDYNSTLEINSKNLEIIQKVIPVENRFHYLRPVIQGVNASVESVSQNISIVRDVFHTSVIGGLRVNETNAKLFNINSYDKNHKLFEFDDYSKLINECSKINHCIIRHTSCVVAMFMGNKNRLGYWGKEMHCTMELCPNYANCSKDNAKVNRSEINKLISRFYSGKYNWTTNDELFFVDPVSQEFVAFIRTTFGITIKAEKVLLSPSEREITNEKGEET